MIWAVLPVKDPRHAKQRLAAALGAGQREALARAMFEQSLETLLAARGIDRVAVVTSDEATALLARRCGALVIEERVQRSHSDSADFAACRLMELGARTVLLVPIDVPLATPADIEALAGAAAAVAIVPSADGTGTNALARTPPDAIPCCFGPGSFRAHVEQARMRGLPVEVLRRPGLAFDLDTPADLAELLTRAPDSRIARLAGARWASSW